MPTQTRRRELLIGGVAAAAVGVLFIRRASSAAGGAPASTSPDAGIPADVLPVAGAGGGGDGLGLSSGDILDVADSTSAAAAAAARAASDAAAGPLGNQASSTPGTGNQVPGGQIPVGIGDEPRRLLTPTPIVADPYSSAGGVVIGGTPVSTATGVTNYAAHALAGVDRAWLLAQKPAGMEDVAFINYVGFHASTGRSTVQEAIDTVARDAAAGRVG
jgi:hypothetical protein